MLEIVKDYLSVFSLEKISIFLRTECNWKINFENKRKDPVGKDFFFLKRNFLKVGLEDSFQRINANSCWLYIGWKKNRHQELALKNESWYIKETIYAVENPGLQLRYPIEIKGYLFWREVPQFSKTLFFKHLLLFLHLSIQLRSINSQLISMK